MSKPKKVSKPNFPAVALLRPRLDALFKDTALAEKSDAEIYTTLDEIGRGIKPDSLLPTLIRACLAAHVVNRTRLDALIPTWLRARNHLTAMSELLAQEKLDYELRGQAEAWLVVNGITPSQPAPIASDWFYQAYDLDDKSQALVVVFWYTDAKKQRIYGMSFLIDYNPPWDGAIKDTMLYPKLDPRDAKWKYVDIWKDRGQALESITAAQAKTKILKCLACNRKNKIRLARDLANNRDAFWRFVMALPDAPDTPRFTDEDWQALLKQDQSADEIMRYEQTVGRRVRMEDGKELLVMGNLDDWN
ncbi:MAG: hypothetical protein FJ009_15510 [Chloroflexi bacterium]|nr:hypothetical protein [Chloroflexota bacterium]